MKSVGTRFLVLFGTLAVLFSVFMVRRTFEISEAHLREMASRQAEIALKFNLAIRDYGAEKIRPVMARLARPGEFIPETMSTSFMSRSIFEQVQHDFPETVMRLVSDNPRNPSNKASPEELRQIDFFRRNPGIKQRTAEIEIDGRHYLATFTPKLMTEECLWCHGDPRHAPEDMVRKYGPTASFGRALGEVVGIDMVAVSLDRVKSSLTDEAIRQVLVMSLGLVALFASVVFVFRFLVTRRLGAMSRHLEEIAATPERAHITPVEVRGNDEIAATGRAFNRLLEQLETAHASLESRVAARTAQLAQANDELRREIEERVRAEEALRKSQEMFAKTFDQSPVWVAVASVKEGRYLRVNQAFLSDMGYAREEVIGRTTQELKTWEDPDDRQAFVKEVLRLGRVREREVVRKTKSGRILHMLISAEVINIDGVDYLLSVSQDITTRKAEEETRRNLEAQLLKAQKMEAVGTLAGGVAHDFNNLLQAITGYTELLLSRRKMDSPDYGHLKQIELATQRASELTRQLLTFGRRAMSLRRPMDINREIFQVRDLLVGTMPKMINVVLDLAPDLHPVSADPAQMGQVLMNLAVNAKDAMPQGGTLTMKTANWKAESSRPAGSAVIPAGNYVRLTVSDTGQGMEPGVLDHIFEPFFSTKGVGRGTGLGLAMVYGIVKSHDGQITCQSAPGRGTSFDIFLPSLEDGVATAETKREQAIPPRGQETILLVDDETVLRELGEEILVENGYRVLVAADGETGMEIYRARAADIDLVILDLNMPGMGGRRCLDEILAVNPQAKVLIASGFSPNVSARETIQAGARGFIAKPYRLNELLLAVHDVLRSG